MYLTKDYLESLAESIRAGLSKYGLEDAYVTVKEANWSEKKADNQTGTYNPGDVVSAKDMYKVTDTVRMATMPIKLISLYADYPNTNQEQWIAEVDGRNEFIFLKKKLSAKYPQILAEVFYDGLTKQFSLDTIPPTIQEIPDMIELDTKGEKYLGIQEYTMKVSDLESNLPKFYTVKTVSPERAKRIVADKLFEKLPVVTIDNKRYFKHQANLVERYIELANPQEFRKTSSVHPWQELWDLGDEFASGGGFWGTVRDNFKGGRQEMAVKAFIDALGEFGLSDFDIVLFGGWNTARHICDALTEYDNEEDMKKEILEQLRYNKLTPEDIESTNETDFDEDIVEGLRNKIGEVGKISSKTASKIPSFNPQASYSPTPSFRLADAISNKSEFETILEEIVDTDSVNQEVESQDNQSKITQVEAKLENILHNAGIEDIRVKVVEADWNEGKHTASLSTPAQTIRIKVNASFDDYGRLNEIKFNNRAVLSAFHVPLWEVKLDDTHKYHVATLNPEDAIIQVLCKLSEETSEDIEYDGTVITSNNVERIAKKMVNDGGIVAELRQESAIDQAIRLAEEKLENPWSISEGKLINKFEGER